MRRTCSGSLVYDFSFFFLGFWRLASIIFFFLNRFFMFFAFYMFDEMF
jgi:hypothetical protein